MRISPSAPTDRGFHILVQPNKKQRYYENHFVVPLVFSMVRQEVENLRFSPFFKFFILSPFSHLDVLLYAFGVRAKISPQNLFAAAFTFWCNRKRKIFYKI